MFFPRKVLAFNTSFRTLTIFKSHSEAIKNCPGLEIAEGDWLFFDAKGKPLDPVFSVPAEIHLEKNTYSNGIYTLIESNKSYERK